MDRHNSDSTTVKVRAFRSDHAALAKSASAAVCEMLEERRLLSLTPAQHFIYSWNHLKPGFKHDLALVEYAYPAFRAQLDTYVESLGLTPVAPVAGNLPAISNSARRVARHFRQKISVFHAPKKKNKRAIGIVLHPDDPTPPRVTDVNYYYDQALPNQLAFTFDRDVTATNWNSAVSVIELDTGATIPVSGTYSSALHTIVYNLNSAAELNTANYAAILHGSQITDTTNSLAVVGSDGISGDDFSGTFFFMEADFNRDRTVGSGDFDILQANYNETGMSYSQGDANYDGSVNFTDFMLMTQRYTRTLGLLGTPGTPTTTALGDAQLTIAWNAPSDPTVTEYDVYRNSTRIATGVTATSFVDSTLTPGTPYTYFVVGKDANNDSSWPSPELQTETAPAVTGASFQYQTLPQQVVFNFSNRVTSSSFANAVTILNLNTGTAVPVVSETYNTLTNSLTYGLSTTASISNGNYAAILHGSKINDASDGLYLAGDDGIPGHDSSINFYFLDGETTLNGGRTIGSSDLSDVVTHFGATSATYSEGDVDYDRYVGSTDYVFVVQHSSDTVPLLGTPGTPTAYIASSSSADIFWDAPTNTLVTQYDLYRNSTLIASAIPDAGTSGTLAGAGYLDTSLSTNTPYGYFVVGKDAAGDSSWESTEIYAEIAPATPTYSLAGTATATEGDTYYLDGAFGDANNDEPAAWSIDWGDGSGATTYSGFTDAVLNANDSIGGPAGAFHTYGAPGTFTITGSALSGIGTYAANSIVVDVVDATPTFSVTGDQTFIQGQPYSVSASFTDVDAQQGWTLSWGDGSASSTGTGNIPSQLTHTYTTGTVPRTLSALVTTDDGTYTNTSVVNEAMPTVSMTGSSSTTIGQTYVLSRTFSDPASQSPTAWSIAWGDGSVTGATGATTTFTHVYTQSLSSSGGYTIAAYATDGDGSYYAAPTEVTVTPGTPAISLSTSATFTAGFGANLTNNSTNPGNVTIDDWTVSWGDGTTSWFDGDPGSFPHTYALPGTFTATAIADTQQGTYAGSLSIAVKDGTTSGAVLQQFPVQNRPATAYFGYTSFNPAQYATGYTVNWGDGTTSSQGGAGGSQPEFIHSYHTYGTLTMTAELDSNSGTYTTSTAVYVQPNLSLSIGGPTEVEAGNTAVYEVGYNGSDPLLTYTINWGDGSSTTSTSRNPTHAYAFNPYLTNPTLANTYNTRVITLTASEGSSSITSTVGSPLIWPNYGSGTLTPGGTVTAVEGQPVTLSASFSDPTLDTTFGPNWSIEWDANNPGSGYISLATPSSASASNTYHLAGTYTVVWGIGYVDANSPFGQNNGNNQPFFVVGQEQVVVQHATPTVQITGAVGLGNYYDATPQFTPAPNDSETLSKWTIDWGDGAVGDPPQNDAHLYATPGNYTVHATATTNEGTYTVTSTASIASPTISIRDENGAAYENGQVADYFIVTRSIYDSLPMNVSFTIGGDATSGEYELTDASTSQILTNAVTIPANQMFSTIVVTPVEDNTPEWTTELTLSLGTSSAYTLGPTTSATTEIVNNDLTVKLGDGSTNIILQGSASGKTNLVPLYLNVPTELATGAIVNLEGDQSDNTFNRVDVWLTPTPGVNDQPIIGKAASGLLTNKTWTIGTDTIPTTLWVGAYNGSTAVGDVVFHLFGSDATATPTPSHPTSKTVNSNAATAVYLALVMWNDPNSSGDESNDIAGINHNWLIGQQADVEARFYAPAAMKANAAYSWSVPGSALHAINEAGDASHRLNVPLQADNGYAAAGGQHGAYVESGTSRSEVIFFWQSTTAAPGSADTDTVSMTLKAGGATYTASTTFDVYTPTFTTSVLAGAPGIVYDAAKGSWYVGMEAAGASTNAGINWFASVDTPTVFPTNPGLFRYVQMVQLTRTRTDLSHNTTNSLAKWASNWSVDTVDPYGDDPGGYNQVDPFDGGLGWKTDTGLTHQNNDSPGNLIDAARWYSTSLNDSFKTYLMYQPPGAGSWWVPLAVEPWSYTITVLQARPGFWVHAAVNSNVPTAFQRQTQGPEWSLKLTGGTIFP